MDVGEAAARAMFFCQIGGLFQRRAAFDDSCTVAAGVLDLYRRRADGNENSRRDCKAGGVIGHALRVVAGRRRDHALPALIGGQSRKPIERAALLERRRELQILEFEPDIGAGDLGQRPAMIEIRPLDETGERRCRGLDVAEGNG